MLCYRLNACSLAYVKAMDHRRCKLTAVTESLGTSACNFSLSTLKVPENTTV